MSELDVTTRRGGGGSRRRDGWARRRRHQGPISSARTSSPAPTLGRSNWNATPTGFTLLEIMVVVFILGLLATLVAPKIMGRTDDARRTKTLADLKGIEQALNLYRLDTGGYPTTTQGLAALVQRPETPPVPRAWNPNGYLERVPVDPWGNPYLYLGDGGRFTLRSYGADGVEGGEGKFADLDSRDQ